MSSSAFAVRRSSPPAAGSFALRHPLLVQAARYAVIGGLGTAANALIFLVLRMWWDTLPANLVALVLSTAVSTEVNRRFTFGGAVAHRWRTNVQIGGTVLFYAVYSSAVLMLLGVLVDDPSPWLQSLGGGARQPAGRHLPVPDPATVGVRPGPPRRAAPRRRRLSPRRIRAGLRGGAGA